MPVWAIPEPASIGIIISWHRPLSLAGPVLPRLLFGSNPVDASIVKKLTLFLNIDVDEPGWTAMSHSKRLSQSLNGSWTQDSGGAVASSFIAGSDREAGEWTKVWKSVVARDLIDSRIVTIGAETSVEEACDRLLSEDIPCLVINNTLEEAGGQQRWLGLFDFADVNAFLTLAATRHTFSLDGSDGDPRRDKIIDAAKAGVVAVHLVSNLSDKNPLICLDYDATVVSLLEVFSRGNHRVLIRGKSEDVDCLGIVSDRGLLAWFASFAKSTPSFRDYLANPAHSLSLPSFNAYGSVVATTSSASTLDAMKLMSEEGVSSVAVLDDETGALLSTVSVTDVGKHPDGSTDGVDKYPVYSVLPSSQLRYTIEKILAILAHFATLAGITNVDPTEMQRHRRMSSSSSGSRIMMDSIGTRSRSGSFSATGIRRSPSVIALSPSGIPPMDGSASPIAGLDGLPIPIVVPERRKSVRLHKVGSKTALQPGSAPGSSSGTGDAN
ncbi:hypothetical protein CC1G_02541 [Coprinopsis cinerea okayama7|uniref:CBS domain-containing protein n=1 Tax=Coprinopsis cinerea (strain Okayama-7 / 130 / ATCC MYA-4618 / FGSC 9003) TaxID=240176 RepID=A8NBT1_COPC7|nr:hypothetical protein CC1G_02541 [Coprinopsis cinerea okayama7\|eukprot:XP_001832279.2 hypothetical protein CC1G_02541 [Coprinopsis cinerea okayama7\